MCWGNVGLVVVQRPWEIAVVDQIDVKMKNKEQIQGHMHDFMI